MIYLCDCVIWCLLILLILLNLVRKISFHDLTKSFFIQFIRTIFCTFFQTLWIKYGSNSQPFVCKFWKCECVFKKMLFSLLDPEVHPQPETYWGHVNPIGPRACYDEGKRVAETMCYAYQKQVLISFLIAYKAFCTMLYIFTHFFGLQILTNFSNI